MTPEAPVRRGGDGAGTRRDGGQDAGRSDRIPGQPRLPRPPAGVGATPRGATAAGWVGRWTVAAALVAGAFALPLAVPLDSQADLISLAAIYACVGLSMNVLVGYLGQLSLGHQAFFGIGACASAVVTLTPDAGHPVAFGLPFGAGLAVATLTGAVSAIVLGSAALRIRGPYLAIVTLAYGLVAEASVFQLGFLSAGVPASRPVRFAQPRAYALLCLGFLAAAYLADMALLRSKTGRALVAIRDDERVAASFGINVRRYKLLAFILSGMGAGLAGGLFAHQTGSVVSDVFDLRLALTFVLMTVVGGRGHRAGVVAGAVIFAVLDPLLELLHTLLPFVPPPNTAVVPLIGAALLLVTLIRFPGGIGQQIAPLQQWLRGGRFDLHAGRTPERGGGTGGGP